MKDTQSVLPPYTDVHIFNVSGIQPAAFEMLFHFSQNSEQLLLYTFTPVPSQFLPIQVHVHVHTHTNEKELIWRINQNLQLVLTG